MIQHQYQNPSLSPALRSADLLKKMTVEEKIGQLCKGRGFDYYSGNGEKIHLNDDFVSMMKQRLFGTIYGVLRADWWTRRDYSCGVPAAIARESRNEFQKIAMASRLAIPFLFVEESPHGLMALDATVFPTGLGLGASFDPSLLYDAGKVMGAEAAAAGIGSLYAPILDLALDPRWSRVEECFSENAYHAAELSRAMIRGIRKCGVETTLKHYVGGGHSEGGHNQFSARIGMYELYNQDLRPFRSAVQEGAAIVMSTYHDVDGEPCTGSSFLLNDVLRGQLGFNGMVIADGGAVEMLCSCRVAPDRKGAAAKALLAGCDGESGHASLADCGKDLMEAWEAGLIRESDLDTAVGRLLEIKFALGLFEHPYTDGKPEKLFASATHRETALQAARKSLTLLKNTSGVLPFDSGVVSKIAVIGPNADHAMNMLGDYTAPQQHGSVSTVLGGIRQFAASRNISVTYAEGCGVRRKDRSGFSEAMTLAADADVIVFVPGGCSTRFGNVEIDPVTGAVLPPRIFDDDSSEKESGEGTDRATLELSGVQMELFRQLAATGKPVVTVPILGRPLLFEELLEKSAALLCAWYPGMAGGQAVAEALFGEFSPGGKLPVALPRNIGQLPVHGNSRQLERSNYIDSPGSPLLPFGYGLSYTRFEYSGLQTDGKTVELTVQNTGDIAADEVVQFYFQAQNSPVIRAERELFSFSRIHLQPGEKRTVQAEVSPEILGYFDRHGEFQTASGKFRIFAGGNPYELQEIFLEM